ncbi:hypothetical protein [Sinorhizobium sp. Sb3]|uniref:hypothetical protein n=1 Tax=Sinorhizobium/Ensifer group TaxID=227292 RepID=UPI00071E0A1E|nr:hypothetical protein [Sinorhizobium sp. Sb3]KSV80921.1 hypothetical protein N183_15880 [Sinorhizobium sp. Sb3]
MKWRITGKTTGGFTLEIGLFPLHRAAYLRRCGKQGRSILQSCPMTGHRLIRDTGPSGSLDSLRVPRFLSGRRDHWSSV